MLFSTDYRGRISQIVVERGLLSVRFPEGCPGSASFRLGPDMAARLVPARLDGQEVATVLDDGCCVVDLSGAGAGARLDFHLTPVP
jgi:putative isomerase